MKKKREFNPNRQTPLDNWSKEIDPAQMSGDFWAEEENSPLEQADFLENGNCEEVSAKKEHPYQMFMHPSINVSFGNEKRDKKSSK